MLQTFFSELHIVIAAVLSFAYIFIFIPVCLAYAVHNFMLEFLKIAGDFINIPEVKQVIKMCTMWQNQILFFYQILFFFLNTRVIDEKKIHQR